MDKVRRVEKPWGFELWWAVTELYAGKILHVEQGRRLSVQYHREKDESCYVLSGRVLLIKGPSLARLGAWDVPQGGVWRNTPGQVHSIEAVEESDILEVSTAHLDDVVRLEDSYGRADVVDASRSGRGADRTHTPPTLILLDRDQIARKMAVSRSTVTPMVEHPEFPGPMGYFRGRLVWSEPVVDAWIERFRADRTAQRDKVSEENADVPPNTRPIS
jgi:quercetin dioxygenase-like cupin family protein/predicted DNA-binding transcriptional regulator AlpA